MANNIAQAGNSKIGDALGAGTLLAHILRPST